MTAADTAPMTVNEEGPNFVTPADEARRHAARALLRRESPMHGVDFDPSWALTNHDVLEIEGQSTRFINGPRAVLQRGEQDRMTMESGNPQGDLVPMDPDTLEPVS